MSNDVARVVSVIIACAGAALLLVRAYLEPSPASRSVTAVERAVARSIPARARLGKEAAVAAPVLHSLSGSVSTTHGEPIRGAIVCELRGLRGSATEARCATTQEMGRFTLHGVEAPVVALQASAAGYLPASRSVFLPTAGEDTAPVALVLQRGGLTLQGVVTDATGGAIAGALVTASGTARDVMAASSSDSSGQFRLHVAPGRFVVEAGAEAYSRTRVTVTAPAHALELVLVPASKIVGRVEAQGEAVASVRVVANSEDAPISEPSITTSAADGAFALNDLPAGRYQLFAQGNEWRHLPVWLQLGVGETSAPVVLQLSRGASLLASIRVAGEPCPNGLAQLKGSSDSSEIIRADGTLEMHGLEPGAYELELFCTTAAVHREQLELKWGMTTRSWDLEPGLALTGHVEDALGEPVVGVAIQLEGEQPTFSACFTDTAGEFACAGLAQGQYDVSAGRELGLSSEKLRVELSPGGTRDVRLRLGASAQLRVTLAEHAGMHASRVFAQQVDGPLVAADAIGGQVIFKRLPLGHYDVFMGSVPNSDTPESTKAHLEHDGQVLDLLLSPPELRQIRGVLLDTGGEPIVDTWVRASYSDGLVGTYADAPASCLTDEAGQFVLRALIPGRYDLQAVTGTDEHWFTRIVGGAVDVVLRVPGSGTMQGEVLDARGELVPSFTLTYAPLGARQARQLTGQAGRFALPGVPAGSYQLSVDSPHGTLLQQVELAPGGVLDVVLRLQPPSADHPAATPGGPQEACCSQG
jgi:hypothetical protein